MAARERWPLAVVPIGAVGGGSLVWRFRGQLHATVVVKARLSLKNGELAALTSPPEIARKDGHHDRSPLKSVRLASDLAPYQHKCDVWLTGHCYAPAGQSLTATSARLALYRDDQSLIDKVLHVYGDRKLASDEPAPFQRMPLRYERSFGGIGTLTNPVGVGVAEGDPQPNIVHPRSPSRPAGFGPVARYWRARAFELEDEVRRGLDERIVVVPDGFDWGYYQAAPADQQTSPLRGDEWLVLDGMHPALARVQTRLPFAQAQARLWSHGAEPSDPGHEINLTCDTLAIDTDEQVATLTWRGSFPLQSEELLETIRVGAAVATESQPVDWSPFWKAAPAEYAAVPPSEEAAIDIDPAGTVVVLPPKSPDQPATQPLEPAAQDPLAQTAYVSPESVASSLAEGGSAPFKLATPDAAKPHAPLRPAPLPGAPWEQVPAEPLPQAPPNFKGTVQTPPAPPNFKATVQTPDLAPEAATPFDEPAGAPPPQRPPVAPPVGPAATPFDRPATPPAVPPPTPPPKPKPAKADPLGQTSALDPEEAAAAIAAIFPFEQAAAAAASATPVGELPARGLDVVVPPGEPPENLPLGRGDTVPILTLTPLLCAAVPWQVKPPQASVTVIVKGTFDLVVDGPASIREEGDWPTGDLHYDDDLGRSVQYGTDYAVLKPKADVTLKGTAHAPGGSARAMEVGFRFGTGERGFVRRLSVFGDRTWKGGALSLGMSEPSSFETMPLVFERAFGGPKIDGNPVGVGHRAHKDASGSARLPNLELPDDLITGPGDCPAPACFAPLPQLWRQRLSHVGTYDARWAKTRWPYFPEDFDYRFFQAAPEAQQLDELTGDEAYEIWGMSPDVPRLSGTLPEIRPRCFACPADESGQPVHEISLRLDTCSFDVDEMKLSLVWRGLYEAADDHARELEALFVMAPGQADGDVDPEQAARIYRWAKWQIVEGDDDGPMFDLDQDLDAELRQAEQRRAEAMVRALPFGSPQTSEPPEPAAPTPEAVTATMRQAGASDQEIAIAIAALEPLPAEGGSEPDSGQVREEIQRMISAGESLADSSLAGADLSGMDLSEQDLTDCTLSGADLRGAKLAGANLTGAQLGEADLRGAVLDGACLDDADLTAARLQGASLVAASLDEADLSGAAADGADFSSARGSDVSFAEGQYTGARFVGCELPDADFSDAKLDEAVFADSKLPSIRLYDCRGDNVSFRNADLTEARADGAGLPRANFEGVAAPESVWEGADLQGANFTLAKLAGASFAKANLPQAKFTGCEMTEACLREANLAGAVMIHADLFGATLEAAKLGEADLRQANLYGAEIWKADLKSADLAGAIVTGTKLEG